MNNAYKGVIMTTITQQELKALANQLLNGKELDLELDGLIPAYSWKGESIIPEERDLSIEPKKAKTFKRKAFNAGRFGAGLEGTNFNFLTPKNGYVILPTKTEGIFTWKPLTTKTTFKLRTLLGAEKLLDFKRSLHLTDYFTSSNSELEEANEKAMLALRLKHEANSRAELKKGIEAERANQLKGVLEDLEGAGGYYFLNDYSLHHKDFGEAEESNGIFNEKQRASFEAEEKDFDYAKAYAELQDSIEANAKTIEGLGLTFETDSRKKRETKPLATKARTYLKKLAKAEARGRLNLAQAKSLESARQYAELHGLSFDSILLES